MKNRVPKCFHFQSQAVRYGGLVGFLKMEGDGICRTKKPLFAIDVKVGA